MRRLAVLVPLIAYRWLCGCTAPYSYRLKLAGNPARTEAEACWARCKRSNLYPRCLAACPGVKVAKGSCSAVARAEFGATTSPATALAPSLLCGDDPRVDPGDSVGTALGVVAMVLVGGVFFAMIFVEKP